MPKCPNCGSTNLRPDPKNPGKVLCFGCRKRIPEAALLPDDESAPQPQAQQPMTQPQPQQPAAQSQQQPAQTGGFSQTGGYAQQPQPSQTGGFSQQGGYAQQQPSQTGGFGQPEAGYPQQPQAQQQWGQPQGGYAQQPGFTAQAQQAVAANGGQNGLLAHLFVMPNQERLVQMGATGLGNNWFKAIVYALLFLSAAGYAILALMTLFGIFYYGFSVFGLVSGLVDIALYAAFAGCALVVRKRMALFTKGSWADLLGMCCIGGVVQVIDLVLRIINPANRLFVPMNIGSGVFGLLIFAVLVFLNGVYFTKRAQFFDFEDPTIGCKASGLEPMFSKVFKSVEASMQPVPGNAPGQQWQQPQAQQQWQQPQAPQQPQQQWGQPQAQQQWQQPQVQGFQGTPQGQQDAFSQPQAQPGEFGQQGAQADWQNGSQGF